MVATILVFLVPSIVLLLVPFIVPSIVVAMVVRVTKAASAKVGCVS